MPFFNAKSGTLAFDNGMRLTARMGMDELEKMLCEAGGDTQAMKENSVAAFPACPAAGGALAVLCTLREKRLQSVSLFVTSIGNKTAANAERQRAFLFHCFAAKDPCPDTLRNCILTCDFGSVILSTDPRVGSAEARVIYRGG